MHTSHLNTFDDSQLIAEYKQSNNIACVGVLHKRYAHLIFGVCMKYLKNEDDAQDASIQIFEKLLIEIKKHEIKQFKAWLHMVCKNFCLMEIRAKTSKQKQQKDLHYEISIGRVEFESDQHHSVAAIKELHLTIMEECLQRLNAEQKICIELFFLQEKSYQEVTEITSYNMNNVKSYIQNGKRNLKICMEGKGAR
jgi:RNA polymerase sigma-70 factor (ECF subfamily)